MIKMPKKCSVFNDKHVVFIQNNKGYCGTSTEFGYLNIFGYCIKKSIESPELIKYRRK